MECENVSGYTIINLIGRFNAVVSNIMGKAERWRKNVPEAVAMCLYTVMHFVMCIFHEPWFDEAQAWQITRCASVRDILFRVTHFEGHTSLWDFILMPFAKTGEPFELSLSIVSFLFAGTAVALILWRSPFPRLVRLLIPFTYFFFYQYGVICRVYCVMMLAFVLMAMFYKERDEKPGRFVLSMMLLAYIMPYGLLMAGVIALLWVIEIWDKKHPVLFIKSAVKDKRMYWLLALLAGAVFSIYQILPWPDTYAIAENKWSAELGLVENGLFKRLLYTLFVMPADATITTVWDIQSLLQYTLMTTSIFIAAALVGILIWGLLIDLALKKRTLLLLLLPYLAYAGFAAVTYMSLHHIGITVLFGLFFLWVSLEKETVGSGLLEKKLSGQDMKLVKHVAGLLITAAMAVSLVWNIGAMATDIRYIYSAGRYEAAFIKELGLDQYTMVGDWRTIRDKSGEIRVYDLNCSVLPSCIAPYTDHNMFYNFNHQRDDMNYIEHRIFTDEEALAEKERLQSIVPDVFVGMPDMEVVYGKELSLYNDYTPIYVAYFQKAWKLDSAKGMNIILIKNELAEKLQLEPVEYETNLKDWSEHPRPITSLKK